MKVKYATIEEKEELIAKIYQVAPILQDEKSVGVFFEKVKKGDFTLSEIFTTEYEPTYSSIVKAAILENYSDLFEMALDYIEDLKKPISNWRGVSILHYAAHNDFSCMMKKIIEREPSLINLVTKENHLPLHFAVSYGDFEKINILVNEGSKLFKKSMSNRTPLDMARSRPVLKVLKFLNFAAAQERMYVDRNVWGYLSELLENGKMSNVDREIFSEHAEEVKGIIENYCDLTQSIMRQIFCDEDLTKHLYEKLKLEDEKNASTEMEGVIDKSELKKIKGETDLELKNIYKQIRILFADSTFFRIFKRNENEFGYLPLSNCLNYENSYSQEFHQILAEGKSNDGEDLSGEQISDLIMEKCYCENGNVRSVTKENMLEMLAIAAHRPDLQLEEMRQAGCFGDLQKNSRKQAFDWKRQEFEEKFLKILPKKRDLGVGV